MILSERDIETAFASGDKELISLIEEYLSTPYNYFEPRITNAAEFDEQAAFINDKFPGIAVVAGGNASGKSVCAAYKASKFILETPAPRPLTPYLICSQTFDMVGAIWQEKFSQFIPKEKIHHINWRSTQRQWPRAVILKPDENGNNWVLDFRSYAEGREQFQSISAGGFICDELAPHEILTEIWTRCRDYNYPGSKIYVLTPLEPAPELELLFNNRDTEAIKKAWKFYRFNTSKNTALSQEWFDTYYSSLPADMLNTRMLGDFMHYEGLVFKEFDPLIHVVKPFDLPSGAYHYRGVDFGWRNAACVWIAEWQNKFYVYHELQTSETFTEDFANKINEFPWPLLPNYKTTYADYEDPEGIAILNAAGVPCVHALKSVNPGIETMRRAFIGKNHSPDLFIFSSCPKLIQQIKGYIWKKRPKAPLNPENDPDEPVKKDDQLVDATRYVLHSLASSIVKPWKGVEKKLSRGISTEDK
jgi:hypothetical protein